MTPLCARIYNELTRRSFIIFVASTLALCACNKPPPPQTLTVFAAASLTESFTDIAKRFESQNPGISIQFNFAGSQDLRSQIENGADADLFASANEKEMNTAMAQSLIDPATIHVFAHNGLVVIYPKTNPARISTLADLAKPGTKIDLADVSVPVGKYSAQMLDSMSQDKAYGPDYQKQFLSNVVSLEQDVKAVLNKVRLGEVDAGIVYVTDVTPDAGKDVATLGIPGAFNQIASYPIAVVAKSPHPDLAGKFESFVLSSEGQAILSGYNFAPASAGTH